MRVCVFGSSASTTKSTYVAESVLLGKLIADRGYICVNGAGKSGVMGGVNDGCLSGKGVIKGVIHKQFVVDNGEDLRVTDLIITEGWDLSERKDKLFENGDCVICMPGGVGTFDELWDGMKRAKEDGMLYLDLEEYFHVATTSTEALDWCEAQFAINSSSSKSAIVKSSRVKQRSDVDTRMPVDDTAVVLSPTTILSFNLSSVTLAVLCLGLGYAFGIMGRTK